MTEGFQRTCLEQLEAEAIYVLREVAGQFANPCLLFSGGKDSIVLAVLASKAFWPGKAPFPLVHIDTGHNFPETLAFRDRFVQNLGLELVVGSVQDSINQGRVAEESGPYASRNSLQTVTLLDTIKERGYECCLGGARRDEEKARAKERFLSHRNVAGQWDPKNQRPELWGLLNGRKSMGEHFRAFPLSNFTELDIWLYLREHEIEIPSLYFSHQRRIVERQDVLLAASPYLQSLPDDKVDEKMVRFRTIGDMTCTGAVLSEASDIEDIVREVAGSRFSERGGRFDDRRSETSMEDRKRLGYF